MTAQIKEKAENAGPEKSPLRSEDAGSAKAAQNQPRALPFVTLWQDEAGVIQIKLGNDLTPVNAVALLELGSFRYKAGLLPVISPRPTQAPNGSAPSN